MKFPDKLEFCNHCEDVPLSDIIDIYGHVQNCGYYDEGRCDIDNKLCQIAKYERVSQSAGREVSLDKKIIQDKLANRCKENDDYRDGVNDSLNLIFEDDNDVWKDPKKILPVKEGQYLVYISYFDYEKYDVYIWTDKGWNYSGLTQPKELYAWCELNKPRPYFEEIDR